MTSASIRGRSLSSRAGQPMRTTLLHPIENAGSKATQKTYIIGEKRESDRGHPESQDREEAEKPAKRQRNAKWNPQPTLRGLPDEADPRANPPRQVTYELIKAPIIASARRCRNARSSRSEMSHFFDA